MFKTRWHKQMFIVCQICGICTSSLYGATQEFIFGILTAIFIILMGRLALAS